MTKERLKLIHLIYGVVLSIALVTVGILLIVACVSIYNMGDKPFTYESIGAQFAKISVFVYVCIALILGGIVLNIALPLEKKKSKAFPNERLQLDRITKVADYNTLDKEAKASIEKQQITRMILISISFVLIVIASVRSIIYAYSAHNFDDLVNINSEIIKLHLALLRYFLIPFIFVVITAFLCKRSIKIEISLFKDGIKKAKASHPVSNSTENETVEDIDNSESDFRKFKTKLDSTKSKLKLSKKQRKYISIGVKCAVLLFGIAFIILGVINGGLDDVIAKATAICTECIGLG